MFPATTSVSFAFLSPPLKPWWLTSDVTNASISNSIISLVLDKTLYFVPSGWIEGGATTYPPSLLMSIPLPLESTSLAVGGNFPNLGRTQIWTPRLDSVMNVLFFQSSIVGLPASFLITSLIRVWSSISITTTFEILPVRTAIFCPSLNVPSYGLVWYSFQVARAGSLELFFYGIQLKPKSL